MLVVRQMMMVQRKVESTAKAATRNDAADAEAPCALIRNHSIDKIRERSDQTHRGKTVIPSWQEKRYERYQGMVELTGLAGLCLLGRR
jgi:hypothetical protein